MTEKTQSMECRSALYMPGGNPRVLLKGPVLPADAIIIDLEDSVAPANKDIAREQAVHALSQFHYGYRVRALRINAADSPWHEDDVAACVLACPDAIVLPKVETAQDVSALSVLLDKHPALKNTRIWAMIESPLAVLNARSIAECTSEGVRLAALLIGNNDLAVASNMRVTSDRSTLLPWLMHLVAVAHAHGLVILDGVFNDFSDASGFERECSEARAMGMHGKTLIHPSQVAVANEQFMPSPTDVANARRIVDAFSQPEHAGVGVLQIDGRMVERLHLHMAEALLARVARLADRG